MADGGTSVRIRHDVHGACGAGDREVVFVGLLIDHPPGLRERVVAERADVTLHACHSAERCVANIVLATAAFNVAAQDQRISRLTRCGQAQRSAPGIRQQRVLVFDCVRAGSVKTEQAARSDLGNRMVIVERRFEVDPRLLVDVVADEGGRGVTIRRALEVVQRAIVVQIRRGSPGTRVARRVGNGEVAVVGDEAARIAGARSTAVERLTSGCKGTCREVALRLQQCFFTLEAEERRGVALPIREVSAERDAQIGHLPIIRLIARRRKTPPRLRGRHILGVTLAVAVEAVVGFDLNALEAVVHDEVHHARHGIGAVHRGRAAGEHVDPADQRHGNLVQVGCHVARAACRHPSAVYQHQGATRTQVAQVDRRDAGVEVVEVRIGAPEGRLADRRVDLQQAGDVHRPGNRDVLRREHLQRRGRLGAQRQDARTGDFDALILGECRAGP